MNPHELSTDQLEAIAAEAVDPNSNGITLTSPEVVEPRTPQDAAGLVKCEQYTFSIWFAYADSMYTDGDSEIQARRNFDALLNRKLSRLLALIGDNKAAIHRLEQGEQK